MGTGLGAMAAVRRWDGGLEQTIRRDPGRHRIPKIYSRILAFERTSPGSAVLSIWQKGLAHEGNLCRDARDHNPGG